MVVQIYKDSKSILFEDYIMILDKIVEKIIIKKIKEIKEKGIDFIQDHKDEVIELAKIEVKHYIEEHKDEIIQKATDIALEMIAKNVL